MKVHFYRGASGDCGKTEAELVWADTPFGPMVLKEPGSIAVETLPELKPVPGNPIAAVDLEGLDRDGVELIVGNILARGYLDKPGVQSRDDAVLYVLVNEAIHKLEQIAAKEAEDS